jgi:predicted metal-dependent peptidase
MSSVASRLFERLRSAQFFAKYPFHAALLGRLHVVDDTSVDWLAVSLVRGTYYLHINEAKIIGSPQYLPGIVLHELHHIALGHLALPQYRDSAVIAEVMDLCLEMSANEGIAEPLPSPIVWEQYKQYGVRARQSAWERYALLEPLKSAQASAQFFSPSGAECVDDHGRWSHSDRPTAGTVAQTAELIEQCLNECQSQSRQVRIAGLFAGQVLERLREDDHLARHHVDWRCALSALVHRVREPRRDWMRPNRRFADRVGAVPGRARRSVQAERVKLLVAIDTSSSVSAGELKEVSLQLEALSMSAAMTVVECDASVHRVYPFNGPLKTVFGRGGTDFSPVFEARFLNKHRADAVVYFTDGDGTFPAEPPPLPVLWVLTRGEGFLCPWGERVRLDHC